MGTTGTRNIKGIIVKLPKPAEITLHPECFHNMVNLQIFINHNASLCGDINDLPNALRLIDWDRCQLQSLPPNFQGNDLVEFKMPDSHIRQLEGFKHWPNLTSMNLSGCQFLEKIPDLSGIPNIEYLNLRHCTSLVEVDDSVGFLDKLVELDLMGCVKLTRFGTRLRLKSLEILYLRYCKMLESFPEIEVEMESLETLDISESGVRELPSSIAYLTGLRLFVLHGCFNLTRFATLGLKSLEQLDLRDCKRLESLPEIEVEMESLWHLDISGSGVRELSSLVAYLTRLSYFRADNCENLTITVNSQVSSSNSELQLLPNLIDFCLRGCNLSKIDFLLSFDFRVERLDLSGNNFVILPICFSKFVNLKSLNLSDCKNLLEIPEQVLPRRVENVWLDNCTSLEKIPKMAWVLLDNCTSLEKIPKISPRDELELSLVNCVRLRRDDIIENIFRNQVSSHPHRIFKILLSGEECPKWFSCRKVFEHYCSDAFRQLYAARCEFKFEIPPHLKWETSSLVLCAVNLFEEFIVAKILVDGVMCLYRQLKIGARPSHVQLTFIPLLTLDGLLEKPPTWLKQSHMCQVIFDLHAEVPIPVKMACGVHLLGDQVADVIETDVVDHGPTQLLPDAMAVDDDIHDDQHQDSELLSLSLASKTTLGKRPHESDFMALDNGPADTDHPKRRHINPDEEPKQ